jgi:bla regulator protein BlaR1
MIITDLSPLVNHLVQSTFCIGVVWLLTLALRKNSAAIRYWLWMAASVKFLIPFSALVTIGSRLGWRTLPAVGQSQLSLAISDISRPFVVSAPVPQGVPSAAADHIPAILLSVWLCGFAASIIFWFRSWRTMREARRQATLLAIDLPIPAMASPASAEPGVFGIRDPVLLLPKGIEDRLTPDQLDAVLSHEMCHVRRRDNLTGAIHLVVEAVFWFHPLVWWIRGRLLEERERACDEAVLQSGSEPKVYAEGILTICKLYVESPLVCVSGIAGSNLRKRIEEIMGFRVVRRLDWWRRLLLITVGAAMAAVPIAIGLMNPTASRAQSQPSDSLAFEVSSVKANTSGSQRAPSMILPGGRFTATNNTVRALILNAYGISASPYLLEGGPGWIESARYDVEAKADVSAIPAGTPNKVMWEKTRLMLRKLLADRFKLTVHRETKEMSLYQLVVAKNGPKLQKSDKDCAESLTACHGFSGNPTRYAGTGVDMSDLALLLSSYSERPVLDGTNIQGLFDIKLQWNPFAAGAQPAGDDGPRAPGAESREGPRPDIASLPTLFTALEQQVGLKLESRKGPVEIWVIDRVERPTEN